MEQKNILCIYHKDCIDGTTAAAVLLSKFPEAKTFPLAHNFKEADFVPILAGATQDTHVYTVDCTFGVEQFLEKGATVTTIDHHIGAKDEMDALDALSEKFTYIFDNEKSGASLSWAYFFPDIPTPPLLLFVEDSDLGRWKLEAGRNVNSYLSMLRNSPEKILPLLINTPDKVAQDGAVITQFSEILLEESLRTIAPVQITIGEHTVSGYNIFAFHSAAGNILSRKLNTVVCLFTIQGDAVRLNFRSMEGQHPTSLDLAQIVGGGGHKHAAGGRMPLKNFIQNLKV